MSSALSAAALLCAALGLLSALTLVARLHDVRAGLAVLLELLLAAALLRLAGDPGWAEIAGAAVVVALRRLLSGDPARRDRQPAPRHRPVA